MNTATSRTTVRTRSLAFAGALAALTFSATSIAASPSDSVPAVTVRYDDLNLATPSGVASLYSRISVAARAVCPNPDIRDLAAVTARNSCRAEAIARAVSAVNNPKLAALHTSRVSRG
jgi:UrcA family protein